MNKRVLALLLVGMMLLAVTPALSEKTGDYEVTYLSCWQGAAAGFAENQQDNPIANIISERFGIKLIMSDTGGGVSEVAYLNTMFAADTLPDMVNAPYWGPGVGGEGYVIINGAKEGMIKDIAPYLDDYPNLKANYDIHLSKTVLQNLIYNKDYPEGALYFIPVNVNANAEEYQTMYGDALYARADVLEALDVDRMDVTNLDQFYELLVKIRDAGIKDFSGNPIIPFSSAHQGWRLANVWNYNSGNTMSSWRKDENGKIIHYLFTDYPEFRAKYMRRLVAENLIDMECFSQSAEISDQKVAQGKYATMAVDANWSANQYFKYYAQEHPECKWVRLNITNKDGNPSVDVYGKGWTGGGVDFFRKDIEEDKLRAILNLMEYMSTPEGFLLSAYGIEGETYTMDAGYPQVMPEFQAKADVDPKTKQNFGLGQFNHFVPLNMASTWWAKPRETMPEVDQYREELLDEMRPRTVIDKLSIDEIAKTYEGYADYQDKISTLSVGEKLGQAYFFETEEEIQAVVDEIRQVYLDAGVEEIAAYIEEQLKVLNPDDYAF